MNRSVLKNASWIIGCKVIQSLISFVIGMITARYLGPSQYGLVNYAVSFVAFFQPFTRLGFDATLVHELIKTPEKEGEILGTSFVFSLAASVASVISVAIFAYLIHSGEIETVIVCFLYSFLLIFRTYEIFQRWFYAKLKAKYISISALMAHLCVSGYKVYILATGKGIYWFAVTHVIEAAIICCLLIILYGKNGGPRLSFSYRTGMRILHSSKHYIWSAMAVILYQQTDRIMLKTMLGSAASGYYSSAMTCAGITAFVFGAIIDSYRPSIMEAHKSSQSLFEKRIIQLFALVGFLAVGQGVFMTSLAKPMIGILYGNEYMPSAKLLQILVWSVVFSYFGIIRNIWILAEGKHKWLLPINIIGAVFNIICNWALIPAIGAEGAAFASVATQILTNFVLCFVIKPMRPAGRLLIRSLNPTYVISCFKKNG